MLSEFYTLPAVRRGIVGIVQYVHNPQSCILLLVRASNAAVHFQIFHQLQAAVDVIHIWIVKLALEYRPVPPLNKSPTTTTGLHMA